MREYLAEYYATPARRGTLWVVAAHTAFFAALLAVMFYLRWASEAWPSPFHFASLIMVAALTMFALSGSVTMEIAARAAKLKDQEPAVRWIAVGIATWLTFLDQCFISGTVIWRTGNICKDMRCCGNSTLIRRLT